MCLAWGLPVSLFGNSLNGPYENLRLSRVGAYRGCTWGRASPVPCVLALGQLCFPQLGQRLTPGCLGRCTEKGAMTSRPPGRQTHTCSV